MPMVVVWTVSWPQRRRERCPGIARYYSLSSPSFPLRRRLLLLLRISSPARRVALSLFFSFLSLSLSILLGQAFSPAFPRSFYRERTSRVTLPLRLANMAAVRLVYLLHPPRRGQKTHEESAFCAPPVPTIPVEPPRSLISSEK